MALRKSYRIKKENEFQSVYAAKNSAANRYFVIYHIKNNQPHFRVGISVGKKVSKLSVDRNRVKRYLTHTVYEHRKELKSDTDFIIIARKRVLELDYLGVQKNLLHCLTLANISVKQGESG